MKPKTKPKKKKILNKKKKEARFSGRQRTHKRGKKCSKEKKKKSVKVEFTLIRRVAEMSFLLNHFSFPFSLQFGGAEKWWAMEENRWVPPFSLLQNHSNQIPFLSKISPIFSFLFFILSIFTPTKDPGRKSAESCRFKLQT